MLTQMLGWFHTYCTEHNLRYYILGGTMLGAMRHGGFIPWDDDIDVGMPRKDYEILIEQLHTRHGDYIVESPRYHQGKIITPYAKLYHMGTTLIEKSKYRIKKGIYIDIFPLDGFGDSIQDSKKYLKKIFFWANLLSTRICVPRKGRSALKNAAAIAGTLLPVPVEKLVRKIDRMSKVRDFDEFSYCGNAASPYRTKSIMPREYFGTPVLYPFEDIVVCGVEKPEEYLSYQYGNWNQLPPEEQRISRHEYELLDLNRSYSE